MSASKTPQRFSATDLTDTNIAAGAGIASSKLADGANFLKKDGSVTMTGSLDSGNNKLLNVGTGTVSTDGVNKGQLDSAIAALNSTFKVKPNARAATTGNITISNPGTATFDGVTLSNGEILFVRVQTAPAENGLYTFNGSGIALTRISQMDAWIEVPGAFFAIEEGTTYADTIWLCTSNTGGTLGTTAITFNQIPSTAGLTASNFVTNETPAGTVNGSNVTFTLAATPTAGSEEVYIENVKLISGAGNDYTISGAVITMLAAPLTGERVRVSYRK